MDTGGVGPPPDERVETPAELRTFLIADVRGYTAFTQRHGDEKAAKLAARFASVTRTVVIDHGGSVLELRGDEALCVFASPRQALRCAVALQQRYVEETRWDSELPLPVGIGIDMGEAVPVEGGYRGGALNMAARLCGMAKSGEILATDAVTHLARRVEGMSYVATQQQRLKGIDEPVRPIRVIPDGEDPARQLAVLGALPPPPQAPLHGPTWLPAPARRHPALGLSAFVITLAVIASIVVVATKGTMQASLRGLGENVVGTVDVSSAHLVSQAHVGTDPQALAAGNDFIWVANGGDETVSRVDPKTHVVTQTVQVGSSPTGVAVGGGAVWVANSGSGTVTRIDPNGGSVTQTITTGGGPSAVAFENGSLWVVDQLTGRVLRIDPNTARVTAAVEVGDHPSAVAADSSQLWISNAGSGTVTEVDARSATAVQTVHVGNDPRGITIVGESVWVANNLDGTVTRIDRKSGDVTATVRVGAGPAGIAGSGHTVWVALADGLALARIDVRTNHVSSLIQTASAPRALIIVGKRLYTAAGANPVLHRGGIFSARLNTLGFDITLDPAIGYDPSSYPIQSMLYDGLVTMRRATGAAGSTVVPDLAIALPTPTDGGRTYVFRLRAGVRWSTGASIRASDIRRGLERTDAVNVYPHYTKIIGADKCAATHCDLSKGVVTDDVNGLVTIHLTAPDPEFLYKLSLLGAAAVPASTPLPGNAQAAFAASSIFPSTGPYRVASFQRGKRVELVRNPQFHEWSHAAQPDGFPDRIRINFAGQGASAAPVGVDWGNVVDQSRLSALRAQYGARLHMIPSPAVDDVFLNTTVAPFDNVKAREAVNYAVDRSAIASVWFEPGAITCQQIPPTVPGYRPYCPYTTHPDESGTWHGPDLAKAQQLVRESGTAGAHVTVYGGAGPSPGLQLVVDAMNAIGYHTRLKLIPNEHYFDVIADPKNRIQAGFEGWLADYPAASNFFGPRFTCTSAGTGGSPFQLCNRALDARIDHATLLQVTSPDAARQEWAAIDRAIVDLAPAVALVNPTDVDLVSERVRHYVRNPLYGPLFDQMWVR